LACRRVAFVLAFFSAVAFSCHGQYQPQDFDAAVQQIRRMPPRDFPELPAAVMRQLANRHCLIPQDEFLTHTKNNVMHGNLIAPNSSDWTVLCSRKDSSSIFVFRQGNYSHPDEFAPEEDRIFLQTDADGKIVYSRLISLISPKEIAVYQRQGMIDPQSPPIRHDAIADSFSGKGITIYYFQNNHFMLIGSGD
jgi:hypothetical protein